MKWSRPALAGLMFFASFFLMGLKKTIHDPDVSSKTQPPAAQHNDSKPLDLSIPMRNVNFQSQPDVLAINKDNGVTNLDKSIKSRAIELRGRVIMSQEPEVEKTKSADGAGIVINLRN